MMPTAQIERGPETVCVYYTGTYIIPFIFMCGAYPHRLNVQLSQDTQLTEVPRNEGLGISVRHSSYNCHRAS